MNDGGSILACVAQNQDGAGLGISVTRQTNNGGILDLGLAAQGGFQIFGIDIHSRRRYQNFFFRPLK